MFGGAASGEMPNLVDRQLVEYFGNAVAASKDGQPQKALAMLTLLLLPAGTGLSVDYSGLDSKTAEVFRAGVLRGIGLWQDALGSEMPITLASRTARPDIVLKFTDKVTGADCRCKGEIRSKRWIQWSDQVHYQQFSATITVCKYADSRLMTESEIAHIVAHELGHALGLGDVTETGNIMGPLEISNPYAKINPSEIEAVKSFRRLVKDQLAQIERR